MKPNNLNIEILFNDTKHKKKPIIISSMILLNFILTFLISLSVSYFVGDNVLHIEFLDDLSTTAVFAITVIFAPLFETFLFQFLIIEVILFTRKWIFIPFIVPIAVSAIAFGLSHNYNIYYILSASIIGLLYALFYLIAKYNIHMNAFISVAIVHASSNFVGFIIDLYN